MTNSGGLQDWMCRATAFELLSFMFLTPTKDAAESFVSGEFADACEEVLRISGCEEKEATRILSLLAPYKGQDADEVFHALRHEHTHIFVGERLPLVTPYVGVWAAEQRGQKALLFVGKESMEIERFMHRCGVGKDLAAGQTNDPLDHVGTVCEFLKFLCLVNAKAVQVPDNAVVEESDFEAFMNERFRAYAQWCSERVLEVARCSFYQSAALLLKTICELPAPRIRS